MTLIHLSIRVLLQMLVKELIVLCGAAQIGFLLQFLFRELGLMPTGICVIFNLQIER